ncbi:MAG: CarD family transcriptional regulator, partial [Rhodospirillales bacterium]|nr:CarD family transcriptional regulator [Rhodospirillales bacterium]
SIERFRTSYRALFGAVSKEDPLYEAVSAGHNHGGMEHWLPLFHEEMATLFDYLLKDDAPLPIALDYQAEEACEARLELIGECYEARADMLSSSLADSGGTYNPLPKDHLYVTAVEWQQNLDRAVVMQFQPFAAPESAENVLDGGGKPGRDFSDARALPDVNVYDSLKEHIAAEAGAGRRVLIGAFSEGSRDRLVGILREHEISAVASDQFDDIKNQAEGLDITAVVLLDSDHGFSAPHLALITEQDILGDRLHSPQRRKIRPENFIAEVSALSGGDLVVHMDHGIGRYEALETLEIAGAPHDCLQVTYDGGDKLFVPVENIDVLSRYGEDKGNGRLDKLGGVAWQSRKA